MAEPENRAPIQAPEGSPRREIARTVAEGVAGLVPAVSILTSVFRIVLPPKSEVMHEEWQQVISDRSNEHDDQLRRHEDMLVPTETIDGVSAQLLTALIQDCPDGLAEKHYDLEALAALLPEASEQDIKDVAYGLDGFGLLKVRDLIGGWSVCLSEDAYLHIDDQVMGWNTMADAIEIALLMLSEDTGHAPELHEKTGWSMRRFYPAFRMLLPIFPAGRKRAVSHPVYPVLGVVLADQDKANLRRLVAKK